LLSNTAQESLCVRKPAIDGKGHAPLDTVAT
jgi:hypothetical protein